MIIEKVHTIKIKNSMPLRVYKVDRDALTEIKEYTGIPVCRLIHIAVPLLRQKYGVGNEYKGE